MYCDQLLLTTTCQSLAAGMQLQWQTGQSKAKYKLQHKPVECLECKNSKSFSQNLHTSVCKYLSFHTVYGFETLGIWTQLLSAMLSVITFLAFISNQNFVILESSNHHYRNQHRSPWGFINCCWWWSHFCIINWKKCNEFNIILQST